MKNTLPYTRDLVLVGGGHTHALILRSWAMKPLPGVRLTVINPGPTAPYSGMLPGFVAGHYTRAGWDIDLVQLGRFAGARVILGAVDKIDVAAKMIDQLVETAVQFPGYVSLDAVATRYGIDPRRHSGEEYLHLVAQVGAGNGGWYA